MACSYHYQRVLRSRFCAVRNFGIKGRSTEILINPLIWRTRNVKECTNNSVHSGCRRGSSPKVLRRERRTENPTGVRRWRDLRVWQGSWAFMYPSPGAGTSKASTAFWAVDDVVAEVAELKARGVVFEEYDMPGDKDGKQSCQRGF